MDKPLFITFEGSDKAGKTTQMRLFCDELARRGENFIFTREPGGTPVCEKIRAVILDRDNEMGAVCEALLYAASRAEHVRAHIRPALAAGKSVVCDRYVDSSIAYQGYGRGLGAEQVANINAHAVCGLMPDITLCLMVDEETAQKRRNSMEKDRLEMEQAAFFRRVAEGYRDIMKENPERIIPIDASGTIEEVHAVIMEAFDRRVKEL